MGGSKIGAAIAGIIRWRLQTGRRGVKTGLRSDSGLAPVDRRIEKVGQLARNLGQDLSRCLGAGRPRGVPCLLGLVARIRRIRHPRNMGRERCRGKGRVFNRRPSGVAGVAPETRAMSRVSDANTGVEPAPRFDYAFQGFAGKNRL
jgi:hypothetical protein